MTVDLRFLRKDSESIYILYNNEKYPITKTDKVANCRTKRNKLTSLDFTKQGSIIHE